MAKNKLNISFEGIMEDTTFAYEKEFGLNRDRIEEINIDMIRPNPYQPRANFNNDSLTELSESIKTHGLLQPIVVVYDENSIDGGYILIAGERRFRACKMLGFELIKAYVGKFSLEKLRELALIENLQRENLNPIELALSYDGIIKQYRITQEELSKIVNKSRTQVTNTLRLLSLSDKTKKLIMENVITQGHAKVLVGLNAKDEEKIVDSIVGQKLSVKETEKLVYNLKNKKNINVSKKTIQDTQKQYPEVKNFEQMLKKNQISYKLKTNKIEIPYKDLSKLLKLIDM